MLIVLSIIAAACYGADDTGLVVSFGTEPPVTPSVIDFGSVPTLKIPQATKPVRLDGTLIGDEWKNAVIAEGFSLRRLDALAVARGLSGGGDSPEDFLQEASRPENETQVYLLRDNDYLYITFRCFQDNADNLMAEPTGKRDSAVWGADSVEVFISHWMNDSEFFHFIVDSKGTLYDAHNRYYPERPKRNSDINREWNSHVEIATTTGEGEWIVQMKLPFDDLGIRPDGQARMNFARTVMVGKKGFHSSWSPVEQTFHDVRRFGAVILGDGDHHAGATIEKIIMHSPQWGENELQALITTPADTALTTQVRGEFFDDSGETQDLVTRRVRVNAGEAAANLYLPYRVTKHGKHNVAVSLLDATGDEPSERRVVNFNIPAILAVRCPEAFYSTAPTGSANITLNVSNRSLNEIALKLAVVANGKRVYSKDVSDVSTRLAYVQIDLKSLPQDIPCELSIEVTNKTTGQNIETKSVSFSRISMDW